MKHIYTCSSKIHGLGIRIGEDVKKGEIIAYIKGTLKFKTIRSKKDSLSYPNWIGVANNQWIDPHKPFKFINHSCNPTVGVKGRVSVVALRDLKEGDEITLDYSTVEGDEMWEMKCTCGEPNCRKVVRSIQYLPARQFNRYLPYVPTYFKNLYLRISKSKNSDKKLASA